MGRRRRLSGDVLSDDAAGGNRRAAGNGGGAAGRRVVDDGARADRLTERVPEDERATELCGRHFAYGWPDHVPSRLCWCRPEVSVDADGQGYVTHRERH
jgi:hypothetical protein